jgi:hypothetical protein
MANIIKLKKSSVENRKPTSLEYGEIALNYKDRNIYYRDANDAITEMKRLDTRLSETDIINMVYDPITEDLTEVNYVTGNRITLVYDTDGDLDYVRYFGTDGITELFQQKLSYDVNKNLIGADWNTI